VEQFARDAAEKIVGPAHPESTLPSAQETKRAKATRVIAETLTAYAASLHSNPDLGDSKMNWQPITQYQAEFGRVIVWLSWPEYSTASNQMEHSGVWESAYRLDLNEGAVWVQAKDCIPIETTGRKVTHFVRPEPPTEDKP